MIELWFDDGRKEIYDVAYPILRKYVTRILPCVAVIIYFVGLKGYMTWDEIKELYENGWRVASHGVTHTDMTTLSDSELIDELILSRKIINNKIDAIFSPLRFVPPYNKLTDDQMVICKRYYLEVRPLNTEPFHCDGWYLDKGKIMIRNAHEPSRSKLELERFNNILDGLRRK